MAFHANHLVDWAAALTLYAVLAAVPALLALVSIIGLVGDPITSTSTITEVLRELAPPSAAASFSGWVRALASGDHRAGVWFAVGLVGALWLASSYVSAFTRACDIIHARPAPRPFWRSRPLHLVVTLATVTLVAAALVGLLSSEPVVDAVAGPLGLSAEAALMWKVARWPVMLGAALAAVALLYRTANTGLPAGPKRLLPGALFAVTVWAAASAAVAVYVTASPTFDATYGTLGGVISLLVWLWVTNVALLAGAQLNAELTRARSHATEPEPEPS